MRVIVDLRLRGAIGSVFITFYDSNRVLDDYVRHFPSLPEDFSIFVVANPSGIPLWMSVCGSIQIHGVDQISSASLLETLIFSCNDHSGPRHFVCFCEWWSDVENVLKSDRASNGRLPLSELDSLTSQRHFER